MAGGNLGPKPYEGLWKDSKGLNPRIRTKGPGPWAGGLTFRERI